MLNYDLPGQPAGANAFGVQYQRIDLADAAGWTNVPASFSPAKQASFTHNNAQIPGNGVWDVYIYDSTNDGATNYNRVLIVNAANTKNGATAVADLTQGEWADAKVTLASGTFAGRTGGFYVKAIDLTADLSKFRLYFTSVQRANATYNALGACRIDRLRGEAEPRLPDLHRGRLRAARGRNRGRGHVRRAGPHVEGRPLGVPRVHPRPRARRASASSPTCCSSATR